MAEPILIAKHGSTEVFLLPGMANRHGCITGATGTGKTVTLQVLAEAFSAQGIPVFLADVKGDLTGLTRQPCGMCSASRATRSGPPCPTWDRCCWAGC
jgi:type IV secretory pathway VirB4 component